MTSASRLNTLHMTSTLTRADRSEPADSYSHPAPANPREGRVLVTGATGFAGSAMLRQAELPDAEYASVNAEGPSRLIIAAASAGVSRVVHISTVGVHGDIEHPPATEESPFGPGDIYQNTKLEGEQKAVATATRLGVPLTVVRPAPMYGPRDKRLLKMFRGVARRRFPILGKGDALFSMVHIDDLVEGVRMAGEAPKAIGRTYIIGSDEFMSLNALVALIAEEAGVKPLGVHLPVWPFYYAGALCEKVCEPLGIEPPLYRRRVALSLIH